MDKTTYLLKEICNIRTGYQKKKPKGNKYQLLKLSNLNKDGSINFEDVETFGNEEIKPRYILHKNEILFKAKSSQNTAGVYKGEKKNLVASGHFFIISIKDDYSDEINSGFLAWYLREEKAQKHFKKFAAGMAMPTVRKSDLEILEISVPSLEVQNLISATYNLMLEEKKLLHEYIDNRKKQVESTLREFL